MRQEDQLEPSGFRIFFRNLGTSDIDEADLVFEFGSEHHVFEGTMASEVVDELERISHELIDAPVTAELWDSGALIAKFSRSTDGTVEISLSGSEQKKSVNFSLVLRAFADLSQQFRSYTGIE